MLLNALDALATVALILALLYVASACGCTPLQRLDKALWTGGSPAVGNDAGPQPTDNGSLGHVSPPPVLELVASGLAAIGFGGMAAWIRRGNKHHKTDLAALWQELHTLETTVDAINLSTAKPGTVDQIPK